MTANRLVRDAVRDGRRKGYFADRLDDLFAFLFEGLVYAQIWEDPVLDAEAMALQPGQRVVCIASGGCNALSYLLHDPAEVAAVDLNRAHVALGRLKAAAISHLPDHETYFRMFGDGGDQRNVTAFDTYLRDRLDAETRAHWDNRGPGGKRRIRAFARGLYREGLLGRFLTLLHWLVRLHGRDPRRMLAARSPEEQRQLFATTLAPVLRSPVVRAACRVPVALYGLGIPPAQFRALREAAGGDLPGLLHDRVERLACRRPIADNWFAWQAFGRTYDTDHRRALPPYLRSEAWPALRERVGRASFRRAGVTDYLATRAAGSVDRFVLLDAQDWMNARQIRGLWAQIARTAAPGARVLFRTAGVESPVEGVLPPAERARWHHDPTAARERAEHDRAAIYGAVHVYERSAA